MTLTESHPEPIIIAEQEHGLPYSKGLMASSMMATGLAPAQAFHAATLLEDRLRERGKLRVSLCELTKLAQEVLGQAYGAKFADRYAKWRAVGRHDRPLVILVGGTTGVGKSTVATALATRLGITRITSTDAIREVMRSVFSEELMPLLYESSFTAWRRLSAPLPAGADPVIVGFREQTQAVLVGIQAIIQRAAKEGVSIIIEGVHLVPSEVQRIKARRAFIVPFVLHVADPELHRSHFYVRELETEGYRPFMRYRENFEAIRAIGEHLVDDARRLGMPVMMSHALDSTIKQVVEHIMSTVLEAESTGLEHVPRQAEAAKG